MPEMNVVDDGSGWAFVTSPCFVCGVAFCYNPLSVPSHSPDGKRENREPICGSCMEVINAMREQKGLPPFPVMADAYEPVQQSTLDSWS